MGTFQAAFEVRTNTGEGGKQVKQDCAVCHRLSVLINGREYDDGEAVTLPKGETHTVKVKDTPEPRDGAPGGDPEPPHTSNQKFTVWPQAVDGQTITSIQGNGPADSPQVFIAKKAEILQYLLDNSEALMAQDKDWPENPADEPMNKTARLLPVDIDFIHPATGEMDESRETSEGGYIAIRRDEQTPVTKLKLRKLDGIANAQFKLVFSSSKMKLWKDAGRTQAVESDSTTFPGNQDTDLFFEGVEKSSAAKDIEIGLKVKIGSTEETAAKARATVVQSEYKTTIQAFIPYLWIDVPFDWLLPPFFAGQVAIGDNRGYDDSLARSFRARQTLIVVPFADLAADQTKSNEAVAGASEHYKKVTSVSQAEQSQKHGYNFTSNPERLAGPSAGLITGPYETIIPISSKKISVNSYLWANEGILGAASLPIRWNVTITFDTTDPVLPKVSLTGQRSGFPAFEIYVENSNETNLPLYQWSPDQNRDVWSLGLFESFMLQEPVSIP